MCIRDSPRSASGARRRRFSWGSGGVGSHPRRTAGGPGGGRPSGRRRKLQAALLPLCCTPLIVG
eukprot:12008987-Alexandrium_andersonii.AAC.1